MLLKSKDQKMNSLEKELFLLKEKKSDFGKVSDHFERKFHKTRRKQQNEKRNKKIQVLKKKKKKQLK